MSKQAMAFPVWIVCDDEHIRNVCTDKVEAKTRCLCANESLDGGRWRVEERRAELLREGGAT